MRTGNQTELKPCELKPMDKISNVIIKRTKQTAQKLSIQYKNITCVVPSNLKHKVFS